MDSGPATIAAFAPAFIARLSGAIDPGRNLPRQYRRRLRDALDYVGTRRRPWPLLGETDLLNDSVLQLRFGQYWTQYRGARALTDQAAIALQAAWDKGDALTARERGQLALLIAEAVSAAPAVPGKCRPSMPWGERRRGESRPVLRRLMPGHVRSLLPASPY